eukprot:Skav203172  [mRNA]  locus=scaffold371:372744:373360:+ [translate_table: standard]
MGPPWSWYGWMPAPAEVPGRRRARIMRVFRVFRFFRQLANWAMMILDSLKSLFGALILLGHWAASDVSESNGVGW